VQVNSRNGGESGGGEGYGGSSGPGESELWPNRAKSLKTAPLFGVAETANQNVSYQTTCFK